MNIQPAFDQPMKYLHRDLSTQNQISMLISVIQLTGSILVEPVREAENIPGKSRKVSGEAKDSAETTFMTACSRLDKIIEDDRRWGIDYQLALEKQFDEGHRKQMETFEQTIRTQAAQEAAAKEVNSPHFRYKPDLMSLTNGHWAAIIGDPKNLDNCLIGYGDNPMEAIEAFDDLFQGKIPKSLKRLAEQRELELNKEHDQITLDTPGPKPPDQTQSGKEDHPGNSDTPRA